MQSRQRRCQREMKLVREVSIILQQQRHPVTSQEHLPAAATTMATTIERMMRVYRLELEREVSTILRQHRQQLPQALFNLLQALLGACRKHNIRKPYQPEGPSL
mmetsp:Transcript_31994/g.58300  ORF Transcript_31994/g.58300 Transcript_31994/m.58300 type:complete len:104 (-) Transcript_31994:415-726(-)